MTKPARSETIRYWHPRSGGWHYARLVRVGRKWAVVSDLTPGSKNHRIPRDDFRTLTADTGGRA